MKEFPLLPVLATMIFTVLSAGVILRVMSSWVEHYATRSGTPHLGTGVRMVGVSFIGLGMALVLTSGIVFFVQGLGDVSAALGCAGAFATACYLVPAGGFCLYWGGQLSHADRPTAAEFGMFVAYLLYWVSGLVAVAICVMWAIEDPDIAGARVMISIFLLGLSFTVAALVDIIFSWNKRLERRHWNLWQMYLAVRSRRPLLEELEFLSDHSWGQQRRRLLEICEEIQEGAETEDLFVRPALLSATEGAQLSTGWKTGRLPQVLRGMLQRRMDFTRDLLLTQNPFISVLYLWFLLLVFGLVTTFLMYWIVPKFKRIFDDFGTELPELTQMVVSSSDALANYWVLAFPGMLVLTTAITLAGLLPFATGSPRFRERLSRIWPRICLPDVLRGLALAAHAKLPLEEALVPFVRWQFQVPLHTRLVRIQEAVREGNDCWSEMAEEKLLNQREAALLRSAQRAGNLPWALEALGNRFEQRWQFRLLFWLEFVRPAVLIVLGLIVAVFDLAFFLPIVELIDDFS